MMLVKNRGELIGLFGSRGEKALRILEEGINSADPYRMTLKTLKYEKGILRVKGLEFKVKGRIYVIGVGKASGRMAQALEDSLGDLIDAGIVVVPRGTKNRYPLKRVRVLEADHPLPTKENLRAANAILDLVKQLDDDDLVVFLVSGGGSALLPLPPEDVPLEEKRRLVDLLLKSGASIYELNTVRKHVSRVKGGWLAKHMYPATVISLIISDVVGDRLDMVASGPTVPDPTSFKDALNVLERYGLLKLRDSPAVKYIVEGAEGRRPETPKPGDKVFHKVYNILVAGNRISLEAMYNMARKYGYKPLILTSMLEGEAREVGKVVASIAREVESYGWPIQRPACILLGGETTVKVVGDGVGGRNQELALSAALSIRGLKKTLIASIGSDGIDGVTDAAGAMVDGKTVDYAESLGLDPIDYLYRNDSYNFFKKVGGLIYTGYTGTNVNDFTLILVD
ncbi:MAG: glycerate kinase [Thermoprotei archaeon]|nr:MAG: glycerate kinase [Thermoprotei archaeon]